MADCIDESQRIPNTQSVRKNFCILSSILALIVFVHILRPLVALEGKGGEEYGLSQHLYIHTGIVVANIGQVGQAAVRNSYSYSLYCTSAEEINRLLLEEKIKILGSFEETIAFSGFFEEKETTFLVCIEEKFVFSGCFEEETAFSVSFEEKFIFLGWFEEETTSSGCFEEEFEF